MIFRFLNLFSKIGCGWVDDWSLFESDKLYRTTRPHCNEALIITSTQNNNFDRTILNCEDAAHYVLTYVCIYVIPVFPSLIYLPNPCSTINDQVKIPMTIIKPDKLYSNLAGLVE